VSLCTICLLAAALLLHSFANLLRNDRGFEVQRVVIADMTLPSYRYPRPDARAAFMRSVLTDIQSVPGIDAAGVSNRLPLTGEEDNGVVFVEGVNVPMVQRPIANFRFVNPDYFRTLGIPIRDGRAFEEADRNRPVAVVSAMTAERFWPGES